MRRSNYTISAGGAAKILCNDVPLWLFQPMPITNPTELHAAFAEAFNSGDIERVLAFYEPQATVVAPPALAVSGHAAIREVLRGFLGLKGRMEMTTVYCHTSGDLALLRARWRIEGAGLEGQSAEIARRLPDGRWLYAVDHPFGAA